jgi:hypothetical protein
MRQVQGGWQMEARREGAARLILKSATGELIYMDFSPDDLSTLRARLDEVSPAQSAPAEVAEPETNEPAPGGKRQRRAKA